MAVVIPKITKKAVIKAPRDPLGIAYSAINLYQALLPGITTQTPRARYYSFVPWMKKEANDRKRKKVALEKLFLLASLGDHDGEVSGYNLRGSIAATNEWGPTTKRNVSIYFPLVKQNADYWYSSQLTQERLCIVEHFKPLIFTPIGEKIIRTFENSAGLKLRKLLKKKPDFAKNQLKSLGENSCICRLRNFPEETEALRKVLFGFIDPKKKDFDETLYKQFLKGEKISIEPSKHFDSEEFPYILRRASLFLLMEIIRISEGDNSDIIQKIRDYVYFGQIEQSGNYKKTRNENFKDIVEFWKVFLLSNYYIYAQECIITGLLHVLREKPLSGWEIEEILNLIINESILEEIESHLEHNFKKKNLEKIFVKDILDLILDSFGIDSSNLFKASKKFDKECINNSWKNEKDLYEESREYARTYQSTELFRKALANSAILLLFLYLRFYYRVSKDYDIYFKLAAERGSLYYRVDLFIRKLNVNLSLNEFLNQLVYKAIDLHNNAAINKLYSQGTHSWWFLKEGNRLFFERNYPTNPRYMPDFHDYIFNNVLRILIDISLIERDNDGMYSLTRDGKKWVERYG